MACRICLVNSRVCSRGVLLCEVAFANNSNNVNSRMSSSLIEQSPSSSLNQNLLRSPKWRWLLNIPRRNFFCLCQTYWSLKFRIRKLRGVFNLGLLFLNGLSSQHLNFSPFWFGQFEVYCSKLQCAWPSSAHKLPHGWYRPEFWHIRAVPLRTV